jgi:hypothetical protein
MSAEKSTDAPTDNPMAISEGELMPEDKPSVIADPPKVLRDEHGRFLPGTARGPGRPHGSKGKLNKTVVETLSAVWERRGDEVLERLADENPAALAAIVSRLVPSDLITQAIEGDDPEKSNTIKDITINLVSKTLEDQALPAPDDGDPLGIEQAQPSTKH